DGEGDLFEEEIALAAVGLDDSFAGGAEAIGAHGDIDRLLGNIGKQFHLEKQRRHLDARGEIGLNVLQAVQVAPELILHDLQSCLRISRLKLKAVALGPAVEMLVIDAARV